MSKVQLIAKFKELETKRGELKKLFDDHKDPKTGQYTHNTDQVKEINDRNDEIDRIADEYQQLKGIVAIEEKNAGELEDMRKGKRLPTPGREKGDGEDEPSDGYKTARSMVEIARAFTKSAAYTDFKSNKGPVSQIEDFDLKTVLNTSTGYPPETTRQGPVLLSAQRMPRIIDVIPTGETTQNAYVYMEETTFTNNAAETAESGQYPEAALAYTEKTAPVRKIAVFIPVTDEQMADVVGIQALVENRLGLMIRQRLDRQLIAGDGNSPNLLGLLNTAGVLTQAKGADPVPDAIYKSVVKIQTTAFADPDNVLMHPNDWQDIRLLRTADGVYIWGSPADVGPTRIWGLPVITSTALTENTAITGDFGGFSMFVYRAGIEFEVSNSHSDFFIKGQLAIRAQMRGAFVVQRPAAFCLTTGI